MSRLYRRHVESWPSGGGVSTQFRLPPISRESSEEVMRDMGRLNALTAGHYALIGSDRYLYFDSGDGSFDPGTFDSGLTGRTGIAANLAAGNQSGSAVATAAAAAITSEGTYTATSLADVVTVSATAAFGTRGWDTSSFGLVGMQYSTDLIGSTYFAANTLRCARLDPAELPPSSFIVTGGRLVIGTLHTAQATVAIYQGGSITSPVGATLVGVVGTTSGAATEAVLFFGTPTPFLVDPTAGPLWVTWMHDTGACNFPFPLIGSAAGTTSNYITSGGSGIVYTTAGPASSNPADFPASFPAPTASFPTFPSIGISYVGAADFQNNLVVTGRIGTRAAASALTSAVNNTLLAGNSFDGPAQLGMSVREAAVAYAAHIAGSNYRLSLAVGGAAFNDFSGGAWYDVGEAGGTDTGWVTVTPTPGSVAIPPSSRLWVTVHHTEGTAPVSSIAYDAAAPDAYGPPQDPAAYYAGNTSESEADDGTLGGTPSTNVQFDAALPQVIPDGSTLVPNGSIYNNSNNVGVRATYQVLGAEVL